MSRTFILVVLLGVGASAQAPRAPSNVEGLGLTAPAPRGFDRAAAQRETRALLEQLVALDTQNPPGNEVLVARHLETFFRGVPGVETHVLDPGDGRANFVARLRATKPSRRAVLVMGHMDVVGAEAEKWTTPPFRATERDGYLYGRGTIDDKGPLAATAVAMRLLAPMRDTLDRDVVLLGTAAEEGGDQGIDRVLAKHFDLIKDAEFALNEGGRVRMRKGRIYAINVQVAEKISYVVTATATGPSGHGSVPIPDNAIAALSRALARVHAWKPAVRPTEVTREYFRRLAKVEEDRAMRQAMDAFAAATDRAALDRAADVLSRDPVHNAALRTGVSITVVNGGIRTNVIPSEARASLNVRVLPDGDIRADVAEMNRIGAEKSVTFTLTGTPRAAPPVSPSSTALFQAMASAARVMAPDAVVIPFMSNGATDGAALREAGIPTYGILPMPLEMDDELRMHGDNERVPVASLGWGTEYLYRILLTVAAR